MLSNGGCRFSTGDGPGSTRDEGMGLGRRLPPKGWRRMARKQPSHKTGSAKTSRAAGAGEPAVAIRPVRSEDLASIIALDHRNTGVAKPDYWRDLYDRYAHSARSRYFLVAVSESAVLGLIIGEVRAWEFGSEPCGWVFAIQVSPEHREYRLGARLLDAVKNRFRRAGVAKIRTMLRRDEHLLMSFFRSQGLMAGPFIQLEMDLDEPAASAGGGAKPKADGA